jgi:hypothetical protein
VPFVVAARNHVSSVGLRSAARAPCPARGSPGQRRDGPGGTCVPFRRHHCKRLPCKPLAGIGRAGARPLDITPA